MTESNPDRFFENIPETEEATFVFDESCKMHPKEKKTQKKILNKCINKCKKMTVIMYGWD